MPGSSAQPRSLTDEAVQEAIESAAGDQTLDIESQWDLQEEIDAEAAASSNSGDMLLEVVRANAQAVITGDTLEDYLRLWAKFVQFCLSRRYIKKEAELTSKPYPKLLPEWICAWIMIPCDTVKEDGTLKNPTELKATNMYGVAQKMRAAVSHKYSRVLGEGPRPWVETPRPDGSSVFTGNPSLSITVSQYFVSLRRRKVRSGEVPVSARAITSEILKDLWEFNRKVP